MASETPKQNYPLPSVCSFVISVGNREEGKAPQKEDFVYSPQEKNVTNLTILHFPEQLGAVGSSDQVESKNNILKKPLQSESQLLFIVISVVMYSKTYCPYSRKLKMILSRYPINDLKVIELDRQKEMKSMQKILKRMTGRSTVPQLFIDGEFIGGHDDTKVIEDRGELRQILMKAKAL
ncbi:unnamed protein product [Cylicostephanus goldi]|uniref:Glutaredoxin domain-containing protein n=1 Tax=Cylicostephanus goldi TaxID=71465 RepID=A0A3P6R3S2_CYLGO|nr:unnamed protein product [Cylicostephanus goldi]